MAAGPVPSPSIVFFPSSVGRSLIIQGERAREPTTCPSSVVLGHCCFSHIHPVFGENTSQQQHIN